MPDDKNSKDGKPAPDKAGKISHDARGNAVWQWGSGSKKQSLDSTSKMLQRLEVPGLELLDEPKPEDVPAVDAAELLRAKRESGFDPYEGLQKPSTAAQQRSTTRPAAPAPAAKPAAKPAARPVAKPAGKPADKPSLLGRLFGKDRDR